MTTEDKIHLMPFMRLLLALVCGMLIATAVPLSVYIYGAATLCALVAVLFSFNRPMIQSVMLLVCFLFIGSTLYVADCNRRRVVLPEGKIAYEAVVTSEPMERGKTMRMDLTITNGRLKGRKVKAGILKDTVDCLYLELRQGSAVSVKSILEKPKNWSGALNFDYPRWMMLHGYVATTFVFYNDWTLRKGGIGELSFLDKIRLNVDNVRTRMMETYARLGIHGQNLAVVSAMTLGDKTKLSKQTKDVYSVTGASHALAVSGLHLGIIYFILSLLFGRKRWTAGQMLILLLVWSYAVLTGLSPSVVRSATMLTLYAVVSLRNEDKMSINTMCFTAFVMLLLKPMYLWDVSFQMSFMSLTGILVLFKPMYGLVGDECNKVLRYIWGMLCVSLCAQLFTVPLVMYYFGRFSCYSVLTNFIVVPAATFILYSAFVTFMFTPFPVLQNVSGWLLGKVSAVLNDMLGYISLLPFSSIDNIRVTGLHVAFMYILLFLSLLLSVRIKHVWERCHISWKGDS